MIMIMMMISAGTHLRRYWRTSGVNFTRNAPWLLLRSPQCLIPLLTLLVVGMPFLLTSVPLLFCNQGAIQIVRSGRGRWVCTIFCEILLRNSIGVGVLRGRF